MGCKRLGLAFRIGLAEAPVTVLAARDRVTGHNPLAAIYVSGSYYAKLRKPELL